MSAVVLTDDVKAQIRWACGYPNFSSDDGVIALYNLQFEAIEWKMSRLRPEEATIITSLLAEIDDARNGIYAARANLEDSQISVITHDPNEMRNNRAAYTALRFDLCNFLGLSPGPSLRGGANRRVI